MQEGRDGREDAEGEEGQVSEGEVPSEEEEMIYKNCDKCGKEAVVGKEWINAIPGRRFLCHNCELVETTELKLGQAMSYEIDRQMRAMFIGASYGKEVDSKSNQETRCIAKSTRS